VIPDPSPSSSHAMIHDSGNGNGINSLSSCAFRYTYILKALIILPSNLTTKYLKGIMGRIDFGIHSINSNPTGGEPWHLVWPSPKGNRNLPQTNGKI